MNKIKKYISLSGPISVAEYMTLSLHHPKHGYYMTKQPLGKMGDFTTAPEISQMFGELIGLWWLDYWIKSNKTKDWRPSRRERLNAARNLFSHPNR